MFTGLVQALGIVLVAAETEAGKRLTVSLAELATAPVNSGDSVCVSGVCLTAVRCANGSVTFDVVAETLARTTLGHKQPQDRVNLELSLRGDSYVGGHFVQGHVDAVAKVIAVNTDLRDWRITFEIGATHMPCIVPKGSITVDGVSMTVAEAGGGVGSGGGSAGGGRFTIAVIPTTLEQTTLSGLRVGDQVNVETDILSRTVVHYLELMRGKAVSGRGGGGRPGASLAGHEQELKAEETGEGIEDSTGKLARASGGLTMKKLRELGLA